MKTDRKASFGIVGIGAVACAACCAGPILGVVAGIAAAGALAATLVGVGALVVAALVIATVVLRRRRAPSTCATADAVAVLAPTRRPTAPGAQLLDEPAGSLRR